MRHEGVFTVQSFQEVTDRMSVITFQIQDDVACFFFGGGGHAYLGTGNQTEGGQGCWREGVSEVEQH